LATRLVMFIDDDLVSGFGDERNLLSGVLETWRQEGFCVSLANANFDSRESRSWDVLYLKQELAY